MTNIMPTVALDTSSLLTAIPGLLGFLPERSLVVIAFDDGASITVTARHDLLLDAEGAPTPQMLTTVAAIGEVCERGHVLGTVVAIVDDRFGLSSPVYRRVCAEVDAALVSAGVFGGVRAGFVIESFAAGQPWLTAWWELAGSGPIGCDPALPGAIGLDGGGYGCGVLSDPQASPVALERSLRTGRVVMSSRSELSRSLATTAHCVDDACGGRVQGGRAPGDRAKADRAQGDRAKGDRAKGGRAKGGRESTSTTRDAALLRAALALLTGSRMPEMTCATVRLFSRAVGNLQVRDALLVLGGGEHRFVAESVWRDLARRTRGETRASAATMLAHLYYLGGEGACAGVALDVALDACPTWRLAGLLNTGLLNGMHPSMLWEAMAESYSVAAGLGVCLPAAKPTGP